MKRAFAYIRISQEDQSNFSLSGQRKMNTEYAEKHGIDIIQTFVDDGYSAKNFNRPQWKQLEAALSANKTTIDYLIVTKYDRLIRNAAEGLAFIEKLEQRWNIKLLSVMENFFIDPHSPYFFKMRADLLVTAEFERRVISDRSKFGTWSAKSQGRFIGPAPFGYLNVRDEGNKPKRKRPKVKLDGTVQELESLYWELKYRHLKTVSQVFMHYVCDLGQDMSKDEFEDTHLGFLSIMHLFDQDKFVAKSS